MRSCLCKPVHNYSDHAQRVTVVRCGYTSVMREATHRRPRPRTTARSTDVFVFQRHSTLWRFLASTTVLSNMLKPRGITEGSDCALVDLS